MYKKAFRSLAAAAAIALAMSATAGEPDGRIVFRYSWIDDKDAAQGAPKLRLSITPVVSLTDSNLRATLPNGIVLGVRTSAAAAAPWPDEGFSLGTLSAGQSLVFDLDVTKPSSGGGIVEFFVQATVNGQVVREGVGVPVGTIGVEPKERDGVVEYPAARPDGPP